MWPGHLFKVAVCSIVQNNGVVRYFDFIWIFRYRIENLIPSFPWPLSILNSRHSQTKQTLKKNYDTVAVLA